LQKQKKTQMKTELKGLNGKVAIQGKTYEITFLCSENEFMTLADGSVINTLTAPPSVTNNQKTK